MRFSPKQSMRDKVSLYARTHLWRVPSERFILPQFSLYNSSCHFNAVSAVNAGRADTVWLVVANGVIHFINSKDGKFFDETWGMFIDDVEFHVIRRIHPSEYSEVYDILCDTKKSFVNMLGSPLQKFIQWRSPHYMI